MALRGALFRLTLFIGVSAFTQSLGSGPAGAQGLLELLTGEPEKPAGQSQQPKPRGPAAARNSAFEKARRKANENVVTVIGSGRLTGDTQLAEDISNVVETIPGNDLRVIPMLGKGAGQNVNDMLYLKGMDMGIVDQDILAHLKKKYPGRYKNVGRLINYITKISNIELHVYAKQDIRSLEDLKGKKISCLKPDSTVDLLCHNLFSALKIDAKIVYDDAELALQKVKTGKIAAAARAASPPLPGFERIKPEDGLHFVPINEGSLPNSDFAKVRASYLPARLRAKDYPALIAPGEEVPTIATASLLAVYAWPSGTQRYQRVAKFVQLLFENMDRLRKPPRHPKWADVNLAAKVPGWTRFPAAQAWLDAKRKDMQRVAAAAKAKAKAKEAKTKAAFRRFLAQQAKVSGRASTREQREALYTKFVQWWEQHKK